MRMRHLLAILSCFVFAAVLSTAVAADGKPSAVFVVTGQLGDKSFNDSAHDGVNRMGSELGWNVRTIEIGRDQTKWEPTFMDLSEEGDYDIIITNGSNAREVVEQVSEEFPDQKYILFDTELTPGKFPNIYAMSYKQNEGSYLAGVVAALMSKTGKIGFVGGSEHPIISDFLVGYIEGAQSVVPGIKVYVLYIGSWDDAAKGKETALAQINQGVDVIFPAAEQAGLGCIEAATEKGILAIGVDSDQALLFKGVDEAKANTILTSSIKAVGDTLVRAAKLYEEGKLPLGAFESLGVKEGGAEIAQNEYYNKNVPQNVRDQVEKAREAIKAGKVTITSALGLDTAEVNKIIDSAKP